MMGLVLLMNRDFEWIGGFVALWCFCFRITYWLFGAWLEGVKKAEKKPLKVLVVIGEFSTFVAG